MILQIAIKDLKHIDLDTKIQENDAQLPFTYEVT